MTLCEKENKRAADDGDRAAKSECQTCLENEGTPRSSLEIEDKNSILGGGKSKRQWVQSPGMYKVSMTFSGSVDFSETPLLTYDHWWATKILS